MLVESDKCNVLNVYLNNTCVLLYGNFTYMIFNNIPMFTYLLYFLIESSQFYLHIPVSQITNFPQGPQTPSVLRPLIQIWKSSSKNPLTGIQMEETYGRVTEEGYLSQDRQTCNRWLVYRIDQHSKMAVCTIRMTKLQIFFNIWRIWH